MSSSKLKGALGTAKVIASFAEMDIPVFHPVGAEHLPYDLVIEDDTGLKKVQVKYRETGRYYSVKVPKANSWSNRRGTHTRKYSQSDFDILALYVRELDKVLYLSFSMCGRTISLQPPSTHDYYWWEDFLQYPPTDGIGKHPPAPTPRKLWLAAQVQPSKPAFVPKIAPAAKHRGRKSRISWPSPAEMAKLVETRPVSAVGASLGVTDNAVRKHCIGLGINLKPRGYWAKEYARKSNIV